MARKLFGTDGVRGVAGEFLTAELALALGRAATHQSGVERPQVLIVRDTRESGEMLQSALAAGVSSAGGDALLGGVLPTPAAPLLIGRYGFDLAVVLSASHNPYRDNGIKFFAGDGYKLSDDAECAIERDLERDAAALAGEGGGFSRAHRPHTRAAGRARGLPARAADPLLRPRPGGDRCASRLRERRHLSGRTGDLPAPGRRRHRDRRRARRAEHQRRLRIHPRRQLAERVVSGGHSIGFAFDGDGDRVLAADRLGDVVDGDELMALVALHLRDAGRLAGGGVTVTVMTNYGFHAAMESHGIDVAITNVGDRYVLEELRARGWTLGGEQSGHIIDMAFNRTGDGIASALLTMEALAGGDLSERDAMSKLPQTLVNVAVRDRGALPARAACRLRSCPQNEALAGRGRVLVRASGTEPLVRVMVEAPTEQEAHDVCGRLVELVRSELG